MAKSVCIADVCKEIFAGGDVPKSALSYEKTAEYNVPIFSNGEKNCGLYGYTNNARVKEPSITVSARGTIGYTAIRTEPFVPVVRLITLTPKSEVIDLDYLFYATQNYKFEGSGTSIPQLTVPMLKKYKFPLPEMSHQKAIAVKFEKLDQLISLRKQQLAKLDELVKAQFVEMFGDPKDNRSNLVKIGEIGDLTSGGTPSRSNSEYFNGSIRWYSAGELNSLYLPDSIEHISRTALSQSAAKLFEKGTLMIGMYDTAAFKMGILTEQSSSNQACANLKPTEQYSVIWLYYLFDIMKPIFLTERQGVRQKNLSLSKIRNFNIPSAPLSLQNQFAAFVECVDQQKQTVQQSLEKLELMKKALMQDYFGELPQSPSVTAPSGREP